MAGDDLGLPEHLAKRPADRHQWLRPTAWLLGTQLLSSLRDILLSSVYEFDPRDWMAPGKPIDLTGVPLQREDEQAPPGTWIDFFADTGDSPRLVYRLAYLLQQGALEVHVAAEPGVQATPGNEPKLTFPDGRLRRLPRGSALIIGGDTAYPVANHETLVERVRAPFLWARAELARRNLLPANAPLVALLGIPGNHDYYNVLHGYVRNFRVPPRKLEGKGVLHTDPPPRLDLPGYVPMQQASYFAVLLRDDWQLWGLDVEMKKLDERQRDYFLHTPITKSRIVVTSQPAMVYHARGERADELAAIFRAVGLEPAFIKPPDDDPHRGDGQLPSDRVQLDLSGDVHTYERYWGTDGATASDGSGAESPFRSYARRAVAQEKANGSQDHATQPAAGIAEDRSSGKRKGNESSKHRETPMRPNYASVVSGLGGAFHHPAQVRLGKTAPRRAWPPSKESARKVGETLVRPRKVFQAGAVGVVGALVAGFTYWMMALVERENADRGVRRTLNLLDVPLATPSLGDELRNRLVNLGVMAAIIGTVASIIALTVLGVWAMRRLAFPISHPDAIPESRPESNRLLVRLLTRFVARFLVPLVDGWRGLTKTVAYHPYTFLILRWGGGDRRRTWRFLVTSPVWLLLLAVYLITPYALYRCPDLVRVVDGFAPLYALAVILIASGIALGAVVGPSRHHPWYGRVLFGVFGALVAVLIIWAWYGWTLVVWPLRSSSLYGLLFFAFWPARVLLVKAGGLNGGVWSRRIVAGLAFTALVAFFVLVPWRLVPMGDPTDAHCERPALTGWGTVLATGLGGYFACLWVGWYFFVCLQWNVHGNEAGGAARVADYVEFLRIKLTLDTAEVWVIAAKGPEQGREDHPITAHLVDHFVVQRTPTAKEVTERADRR